MRLVLLLLTLHSLAVSPSLSQTLPAENTSAKDNIAQTLETFEAFTDRWEALGCPLLLSSHSSAWYQCCVPLVNGDPLPQECEPLNAEPSADPLSDTSSSIVGIDSPPLSSPRRPPPPPASFTSTSTLTSTSSFQRLTAQPTADDAVPTEQGYRGEGGYVTNGNVAATPSVTWGSSLHDAVPTTYALPTDAQKIPSSNETEPFPAPELPSISADVYRHRAQSAVNLGFWLVAEQYGTPEYFKNCATNDTAEINIAEGCSKEYMEDFWSSFITEQDFAAMAQLGINTVRLPIGYWTVGRKNCHCEKTPFWPFMDKYENQFSYVLKAIEWAAKYDIGVLVDFHGAEGSQNGWDHSGIHSKQSLFLRNPEHLHRSTMVLEWIAEQIKDMPNIVGLQLLNEPYPDTAEVINPWYESTMNRLKPILGNDFPFYVFGNNGNRAEWVKNQTDFVVMDFHLYFLWNAKIANMTTEQVISRMSTYYAPLLDSFGPNLIVGEWACTLAEKNTPWMNYTQFCDAQLELLNRPSVAGWHYWSWKTEGNYNNTWSFLSSTGGPDGMRNAQTDQRELMIPIAGQPNFSIGSTISSGPAQRRATEKRSILALEAPHALEIWDHGCRVAQDFARSGSRLGFTRQWIKSKGLRSDLLTEHEHHEHFSRGVEDCRQ